MKKTFTKLLNKPSRILALATMFISGNAFAEGSKDMYPAGTTKFRLMLEPEQSSGLPATGGWHYVYAKAGEKIALATNSMNALTNQANSKASLMLYAPDGSQVVNFTAADYTATGAGWIGNRSQELAGPKLSASDATADRYLPVYYTVPTGGDGIYKVDWRAAGTTIGGALAAHKADNSESSAGGGNWIPPLASRRFIAAWDISVINTAGTDFINGRVYVNALQTYAGSGSNGVTVSYEPVDIKADFKMYIRTFDGYTYTAESNGLYGIYSRFFSNKDGLYNPSTGAPTYKSKNATGETSGTAQWLHNPDSADSGTHRTNKMFYHLPANDMPFTSNGAVPGGSTWLRTPSVTTGIITNLKITDPNGLSNYLVGYGGGLISFTSNIESSGTVTIESNSNPATFVPVEFPGTIVAGNNEIEWDGLDGAGNPIPQGNNALKITVKLKGGEIHFPMSDVEFNTGGITIWQLDPTDVQSGTETKMSDLVWWDDSLLTHTSLVGDGANPINNSHLAPTSSAGISSTTNGHKWGANAPAGVVVGTWGDSKFIDTWSFVSNGVAVIELNAYVPCYDTRRNVANPLPTKVGITLLKRAGADNGNWPMVRSGGHIALESNSKGFVITRVATTADLGNISAPQEGMMVYDGEDHCLKIFSDGAWKCFNVPSCP